MVVHLLHGAGRKQGNLGRYLFFEIGKQRDERHLIKNKVSAEISHGSLLRVREMWGRASYCFRFCCCLVLMMLARRKRLAHKVQVSPV